MGDVKSLACALVAVRYACGMVADATLACVASEDLTSALRHLEQATKTMDYELLLREIDGSSVKKKPKRKRGTRAQKTTS